MKMNLPVMLLREPIFLPYAELKLEFSSESSKNIVDEAEFFHDNRLFVVAQNNPLEENPTVNEISRIGVIAQIKQKIELPSGNTRIVIEGIERATIFEFLNASDPKETLESIVMKENKIEVDPKKEKALIAKLYKEVEEYVKLIPYVSDGLLGTLSHIQTLDQMTDVTLSFLSFPAQKIKKYIVEFDPIKRMEMLLTDIYKEKESYKIEAEIENKVQEGIDQNQKEYLIREKIRILKEEIGEVDVKEADIKKIKEELRQRTFPKEIEEKLTKEINRYDNLPIVSPEVNMVRNYIDVLLHIPFGKYTEDNEDLLDVQKKLDHSHYALDKVKLRIIEFLAAKKMSKKLKSPILCLVGPPGVGKTSLASSIAKALNRRFVKMSVGGMNDEGEIIGHRRTYLGASSGKIISLLTRSGVMNPVLLIDEIDKMMQNEKGDPTSALLDILDPVQNKYFTDNYVDEEVDLSEVFFITTANDITEIPEEIIDRLEIIELPGYAEYEKIDIARKHLLPEVCDAYGISSKKISFDEKALVKIIREYTKEFGVRDLERRISDIIRKIITEIVLEKRVDNTYYISKKDIPSYLGIPLYTPPTFTRQRKVGIVNVLAYTNYGGDCFQIEVNYFKGNGNLILTGTLGQIMKESAEIAFSYIKANAKYFGISYEKLLKNDIHVHLPEGGIPKEGPSAGIALTTALISSLSPFRVIGNMAMTGEITLTGNILPVGEIKEKVMGAYKNNIGMIIVPLACKEEIEELPKKILNTIKIHYVKTYKECYKLLNSSKENKAKEVEKTK